ncbi:MAG: TRAP transporter fused permease subunit [Leptolyngbyaceae cyanobacterium MO_188.B28]|nr:TRAP transporter fused permease subunit [Leptolyngbyaceae cyanobacterium MO_188.B28]
MSNNFKLEKEIADETEIHFSRFGLQPFIYWMAVAVALFHIWINSFSILSEIWRNSLHMGLLGSLGFLIYPVRKQGSAKFNLIVDVSLSILTLAVSTYLILAENALYERNGVLTWSDLMVGGLAIILVLELTRRTSGIIISILAVSALSYILWWGQYIDGIFFFRGLSLPRVLYRMSFTDEGLFGTAASISSTSIFMFILFASFLLKSGGSDFIINLARSLARQLPGGSGLVAVFSSGLMGTISGSTVANTVATGSITIPMMKRSGFEPKFAAGVETAASVGGQIMPPIMGAGAFIMAQLTAVPYTKIIEAAILPAIMYFANVGFHVYQNAKYQKIAIDNDIFPDPTNKVLREGIHFLVPIAFLIGMLSAGYTPAYAAGYSIIIVVISSWFSREHKMGVSDILDALALGTKNAVSTGILLISAGIIIGSIAMTGVGVAFSQMLVTYADGNLFFALVLITIASLLLGMGLPVTAAYIMLAILAAPALENMGISLLGAHFIIFWLSQDSNITPPVCLAAYAAAGIANTKPMAAAMEAWKIAKGLYIKPLLFAYTALIDGDIWRQLDVFIFGLLGLYLLASIFTSYLFTPIGPKTKIPLLGVSCLLFLPDLRLHLIGFALTTIIYLHQKTQLQSANRS